MTLVAYMSFNNFQGWDFPNAQCCLTPTFLLPVIEAFIQNRSQYGYINWDADVVFFYSYGVIFCLLNHINSVLCQP